MILLFLASTFQGAAVGHEISIFAQRGDVFHGRTITGNSHEETLISINNQGEVAFIAEVATGPEDHAWVVMTQNRFVAGAGKVVDGVVPRFQEEDNDVWINDLGQVAYSGRVDGGDAVFLDDKMLFQSGNLIAGREAEFHGEGPVVDRFGKVAFRVRLSDPRTSAIVTQHGIVVESGDVIDGFTIESVESPGINGDGHIAFGASTTDSDFRSLFTEDRRLIGPGDVISGIPVTALTSRGNVNRDGIVTAQFVTGTFPDTQGYAATEDEVLLGPGSIVGGLELVSVGPTQMTGDGLLVFLGRAESDDGSAVTHLFAGDEILLSVGDEFDGRTVREIWPSFEINDRGDVVFQVTLDEFEYVILLATVPEPTTMSMLFFGALLMLLPVRTARAARRRRTPGVISNTAVLR